MKCPNCQTENNPQYNVCMNCGAPLIAQPQQPVYAPAYQAPSPLVNQKDKLLLPELILDVLLVIMIVTKLILTFVNFFVSAIAITGIVTYVLEFVLAALAAIFIAIKKDAIKRATICLCSLLIVYRIFTIIQSIIGVSTLGRMTISGMIGVIIGFITIVLISVMSILSAAKKNKGLAIADIIIIAFYMLLYLIVSIIMGVNRKYVSASAAIQNIVATAHLFFVYIPLLIMQIRIIKSAPKKTPAPVYQQQQYYPPTNNF